MLPYITVGSAVFESYTLITNAGTLIGLFSAYECLQKHCKKEKNNWKMIVALMLLMLAGAWFARLLKGLFAGPELGEATHFLGRVLLASFLLPVLLPLFWKERSCSGQAMNAAALYLVIQHFFNRIACWMNGCCGGIYLESWKVRFPSQLFEAGAMLMILCFLVKHIRADRIFFGQTVFFYAVTIFISEYLIDQPEEIRIFTLTSIQAGALLLMALASVLVILQRKIRSGYVFS